MPDESIIEEGLSNTRISRRKLMQAGAIVGGTVWVAPVIDSFVTPAAAASVAFPCSYADIIFYFADDTNKTLYCIKLNDPNDGCNLNNADGSYSGTVLNSAAACGGTYYGVNSNDKLSTVSGPSASDTFTVIPPAPSTDPGVTTNPPSTCSYFTMGSTVSWTSAVVVTFVLLHDGSFSGKNGVCPKGNLKNGEYICAPSSSFSVPAGCCGTSATG